MVGVGEGSDGWFGVGGWVRGGGRGGGLCLGGGGRVSLEGEERVGERGGSGGVWGVCGVIGWVGGGGGGGEWGGEESRGVWGRGSECESEGSVGGVESVGEYRRSESDR